MKLMKNKGEWSEFYAFVKLLSTGKLYAADENLNRLDNIYFPILKILRNETGDSLTEYIICSDDGSVEVHLHGDVIRNLSHCTLIRNAAHLYSSITAGGNRAFEIDGVDVMMQELACSKVSAPSTDKTDITMQLHDVHTGYSPICGFSIKSEIGNPPTLLNASEATNFIFEVFGLTAAQAESINSIDTRTKIIDRMEKILEYGSLEYRKVNNDTFSGNLMMIDSYMEDIIAALLLDYYRSNVSDCKSLIARLEKSNPLGYPRKGMYEHKFKKLLCSIALGMMPAKIWDGHDEANGGYVIVRNDGEVLAYHLYNRDAFETYLLNNTKLERASTSRHKFASIYKNIDGKMYINLNLQIRFV